MLEALSDAPPAFGRTLAETLDTYAMHQRTRPLVHGAEIGVDRRELIGHAYFSSGSPDSFSARQPPSSDIALV
jgi:hypothetical protein